ncbi:hypothetical protein JZ751_002409 [Albula glossodonta]|uniref:Uncharacterized protein n=1 Tax=Albula glossodonta TaxID=121402 RepID=A0A8T2MNC8_9TELE|nr:hypothetical protein JZ751_002409 [Albula glossodonta]
MLQKLTLNSHVYRNSGDSRDSLRASQLPIKVRGAFDADDASCAQLANWLACTLSSQFVFIFCCTLQFHVFSDWRELCVTAMARRRPWSWCMGPVYLALVALLLRADVLARPANMSALKEKSPSAKDENEILPPDHLNGVKMEMDGHLNKDFHQEVFLGKEMEEFEEDSEPRRNRRKLVDIFSK